MGDNSDFTNFMNQLSGPRNAQGEMILSAGNVRRRFESLYAKCFELCDIVIDEYVDPSEQDEDALLLTDELDIAMIKAAATTVSLSLNGAIKKGKRKRSSSTSFVNLSHFDRLKKMKRDALFHPLYMLALLINLYKLTLVLGVAIENDNAIDKSEYDSRGWAVYSYDEVDEFRQSVEDVLSDIDFFNSDIKEDEIQEIAQTFQTLYEEYPEVPEPEKE